MSVSGRLGARRGWRGGGGRVRALQRTIARAGHQDEQVLVRCGAAREFIDEAFEHKAREIMARVGELGDFAAVVAQAGTLELTPQSEGCWKLALVPAIRNWRFSASGTSRTFAPLSGLRAAMAGAPPPEAARFTQCFYPSHGDG